jgi:hypothetical protein
VSNLQKKALTAVVDNFGEERVDANAGVWVPIAELGEGVELQICRLGNPAYQRMLDALTKPYDRKRKVTPAKVIRDAMPKIYAATIWIGTKGLADSPNAEEREQILRKSARFYDWIHDQAEELQDTFGEGQEAALGNSSTSSAGQ